jgi:hypothetical protein
MLRYSMVTHRHPCVTCIADGQSGRTRPGEDQVRPLALTAVLSYCSRQPQAFPPNLPPVVRAEAAHPLGASARFSDADHDTRQVQIVE